jgi:3-phosphoinositide dependent protein kinase-1
MALDFVLQFARNGDLLECLLRLGSFSVECTRYYAGTILDAVCFMHSLNIVHRYDALTHSGYFVDLMLIGRDLKPENILLDDSMRIKISDFGSAKDLDAPSPTNGQF